jgi:small subunit ribosomal protein S16
MQLFAALHRSFAAKDTAQDDSSFVCAGMGFRRGQATILCTTAFRRLPFHLTSGIIRVCLDLTGLFRNKDIRPVLMIRLARRGARKQPHYRIVVIEKARARNGRPVEVVGTYNPRTNPASIELKRDRVEYWVSKGAQMSDRVNKLFSKTPAPVAAGSAA